MNEEDEEGSEENVEVFEFFIVITDIRFPLTALSTTGAMTSPNGTAFCSSRSNVDDDDDDDDAPVLGKAKATEQGTP